MPSSWPTTARAAGMPPITARTARAAYRLLLATILTAAGAAGAPAADAALGFAVPHPVGGTYQEALRHQVIATYALQRRAQYLAIIDGVRQLDAACSALIAHPSPATMAAARSAWIAARLLYAPSECHRFYSGPIDEPRADLENRINAWPIDESYIDYVDGDAGSGIINHVQDYPVIDTRLLIALNRSGGEKNIATGYHAIEFLLWGQGAQARGPGVRSSADYLPHSPVGHADRRAAYLRAALDLLLADLGAVARAWDVQTPGSYGARFVQESSLLSLQHIFVGMAGLSGDELACERMAVAYETRSMEDGQSCFSFTTCNDLIGNAEGIRATYLGTGPGPAGPGPSALVRAIAPDLDQRLRAQLDATVQRIRAIPPPFGLAIQGDDAQPGRVAIMAAITALEPQRLLLMDAARRLGLHVVIGRDPDQTIKRVEKPNPAD